jgi:hypothetical protein
MLLLPSLSEYGRFRDGGALGAPHEPALVEHVHGVGQFEEFRHFAGDEQHGDSRGGEFPDPPVDLPLGSHVDAPGGLVQNQQLRVGGHETRQKNLLLVTAREGGDGCGRRFSFDRQPVHPGGHEVALPRGGHDVSAAHSTKRRSREVVADAQMRKDPLRLAVLRKVGDALLECRTAGARGVRLAAERNAACMQGQFPANGQSEFAAAGADQPVEAGDLSGTHTEADVGEDARGAEPGGGQDRGVCLRGRVVGDGCVGHQGAVLRYRDGAHRAHHAEQALAVWVGGFTGIPAVAEHHEPVGDTLQLIEPVGDVADGRVRGAQLVHEGEEPFGLGVRENRRRFVQDQHPGLVRDGSGDEDLLLIGEREIAHASLEQTAGKLEAVEQIFRFPPHGRLVEPAQLPCGLAAHEQVLHHREVGKPRGFLVDRGHTGLDRIRG